MFHYKIILFLIQNETANGDSNVDFKRENSNNQALLHTKFSTTSNVGGRPKRHVNISRFKVIFVPE